MTPHSKPQSWPREVVHGVIIIILLLLTLGFVGLALLSMGGIVGGWRIAGRHDQESEIRFRSAVMEVRCEQSLREITEYGPWRSSGSDVFSIPAIFSYGTYEIVFRDPVEIGDLMKLMRPESMPLDGIPVLSGPPPPPMSAWRIRIHLWPFIVVASFYPALALVRFLWPVRQEVPRRRVAPLLLGFLFTVLSILCLVACVGVAAIWFGTARSREQANSTSSEWASGGLVYRTLFFSAHGGRMRLGRVVSTQPPTMRSWDDHWKLCQGLWFKHSGTMLAFPANTWARKFGFGFESGSSQGASPRYSHWWIGVPCWPFILLTAMPPICWVRWFRRRKMTRHRVTRGLCLRCGYNLTGNVSGVCPECGEKI